MLIIVFLAKKGNITLCQTSFTFGKMFFGVNCRKQYISSCRHFLILEYIVHAMSAKRTRLSSIEHYRTLSKQEDIKFWCIDLKAFLSTTSTEIEMC